MKQGIAQKQCNTDWSILHTLDLEQAVVLHEKLVLWVAGRQWPGELPRADVWQVGRIGLWHALPRFDPKRGTALSKTRGGSPLLHLTSETDKIFGLG